MQIELLNDFSNTDKFQRYDAAFLAVRVHPEAQVAVRELAFRVTFMSNTLFEGPTPLQTQFHPETLQYTATRVPVEASVDFSAAFAAGVPATTFVDVGNILDNIKRILDSVPQGTPSFNMLIECRATTEAGLVATANHTLVIQNPWA